MHSVTMAEILTKFFCYVLKHLWPSPRREDPIPAEENVWLCYLCLS